MTSKGKKKMISNYNCKIARIQFIRINDWLWDVPSIKCYVFKCLKGDFGWWNWWKLVIDNVTLWNN